MSGEFDVVSIRHPFWREIRRINREFRKEHGKPPRRIEIDIETFDRLWSEEFKKFDWEIPPIPPHLPCEFRHWGTPMWIRFGPEFKAFGWDDVELARVLAVQGFNNGKW